MQVRQRLPCLARVTCALLVPMVLLGSPFSRGDEPPRAANSPPQSKRRSLAAEFAQLQQRAQVLKPGDELAALIDMSEDLLSRQRKLLGTHSEVAATLAWVAEQRERLGDYASAHKLWEQLLVVRTQLHGSGDWRVTDAHLAAENAQRWAALGDDQRRQLREAEALDARRASLRERAHYADALALTKRILAVRRKLLGELHASTAATLRHLAGLYQDVGDYARAEPLYVKALETEKRLFGEQHPETARVCNDLALLLQERGAYARAERLQQRALAVFKDVHEDDHPDIASCLNNLALLNSKMGDHASAEPLYLSSLEIRERVLGRDHPTTALYLSNLAEHYRSIGAFARAEPLHRRALEIRKKAHGEQHPDTALSLNNLALLYSQMGEYHRPENLYGRALEIYERCLGDHPLTATSLNNLAELYREMGEYSQAEPLYRRALQINKNALGTRHPDTAMVFNNLALLYHDIGEYARAEPLHQRALEIYTESVGEEHPDTANSLGNLATLYGSMGDYARAESHCQRALDIYKKVLGEEHATTALQLNNLAVMYADRRDFARAEPLYKQALAIQERVLGEEHVTTAVTINNLASLYRRRGKLARAEPLYRRALEIRSKLLGEEHEATAHTLSDLAALYARRGDYARAEPLYLRALGIRKQVFGDGHPDVAIWLNHLGWLYDNMGDYDRAEPLLRKSLKVLGEHSQVTYSVLSERQQLQLAKKRRYALDAYLSVVRRCQVPVQDQYAFVLAVKGDVMRRQFATRAVRDDPAARLLFDRLQRKRSELATLALRAPAPTERTTWRARVGELTDERERLEKQLADLSDAFRRSLESFTPQELQQFLPPDTVLVDLLQYHHREPKRDEPGKSKWEHRIAAFVTRRQAPVHRVELGPAKPMERAVAAWRRGRFGATQQGRRAAADLRRLLWEPLRPALGDARTVLISPDGATARLPWAALPGQESASYLIEKRCIAVLPLPQMLRGLAARKGAGEPARVRKPSLLLIGDVDYGAAPGRSLDDPPSRSAPSRARGWSFAPLPHVRHEIDTIAASFTAAFEDRPLHILSRRRATEAGFRKQAPKYRWLHVASHGFFAPPAVPSAAADAPLVTRLVDWFNGATRSVLGTLNIDGPQAAQSPVGRLVSEENRVVGFHPGLLSGLALAGANTPPAEGQDDGILTALEVGALDLRGVELAVLSACDTGLGPSAGGEGVLGLQRALQLSGARTTVTSLWQVHDHATQLLMTRFYENLWQRKMGKLEALRDAQLWMLRDAGRLRRDGSRAIDELQQGQPADADGRLPPYYWAAFVLSGDWH